MRNARHFGIANTVVVASMCLLCAINDTGAQGFTGGGVVWDDIVDPNEAEYRQALSDAEAALTNGQHTQAIAFFQEARALRPDVATPIHHIVSTMIISNQFEDALALANDALLTLPQQDPAAEPILLFQRSVVETQMHDYNAAITSLEEAVQYRQDLNQVEIYYGNLAELYAVGGDLERALTFYQLAVGEQPSYDLARAGLASVLERLGRADEARRHWVHLAIFDPQCTFLDDESLFFLSPDEDPLVRIMIAAAGGDQTNMPQHMQRLVASGASVELIDAVRARANESGPEFVHVPVPDCSVVRFARSNDGRRMAALCDSRPMTLMEGAVVSVTESDDMLNINVEWEVFTSPSMGTHYNDWNALRAMAYSSDDSALRLVWRSQVESLNVVGNGLTFDRSVLTPNSELTARDLVDGEQILFRSSYTSNFQLESWDSENVVMNLTHVGQHYPYMTAIDDAATRFMVASGGVVYLYGGPSWTLIGSAASGANGIAGHVMHDIAPDGDHLVVLQNEFLIIYDADTMQATDQVIIPSQHHASRFDAISRFLHMIGDDTIAVSGADGVLLVDYER